jgi:hypothetical protein
MSNIQFICKDCCHENSKQCREKDPRGYETTCDECKAINIICRFPICNKVFGSSSASSSKKRPWTYFCSHHYRRCHEKKSDNSPFIELQVGKEINEANECETIENEINDDIDFGGVDDMESEIEGGDSLGRTRPEQFDGHLADFLIEDRPGEVLVEMPEEIPDVPVTDLDDGTICSDKSSKCWSIADDCLLLDPAVVEASIDGQDMADDDVDDIYQRIVTEYESVDIDPESVCDNDEENSPLPQMSNENDRTTDCDSNENDLEKTMDEIYSKMEKIFDWRSDDEKMIRKGRRITRALSQVALYFTQKHHMLLKDSSDHFGGYHGILYRMCVKNRNEKYKMADRAESLAVFLYHMLVMNITTRAQELLIQYESEKMGLYGVAEEYIRCATLARFPRSIADIRRDISEGSFSIMKNFPSQRVFSIAGHACVSLRETFCLRAGHYGGFSFAWDGCAPEGMQRNMDGLNGCEGARRVCGELISTLLSNGCTTEQIGRMQLGLITLWSDSYLQCFIKQKDNSVWLLTATVCAPYDQTNTGKYTYVLAMGKSSLDHSEVINYYLSEIKEMGKGFMYYSVDANDFRECALGLIAYCADRPERSKIQEKRQEGKHGRVTDWAVDPSNDYFPACDKCYVQIVKEVLGMEKLSQNSQCNRCCCWTLDEDHKPEFYHKTARNYPTRKIPGRKVPKGRPPGATYVGPKRMSSKWLIAACEYAYEARRMGLWTKPNITEYLRTCNIREEAIESINSVAENDKKNERTSDSKDYVPKIWILLCNLFECLCFDAPMHAIAHGVIPDTMNALHQVLSKWRLFTNYIELTNATLSTIASFQLDWLKIKLLPKAAWIGENTMAYMRLMSYCYGSYLVNRTFDNEVEGTLLAMRRMINSLQAVVSMTMSSKTLDGEEMQLGFKLLLSNAQRFQEEFGSFEGTVTRSSSRIRVVDQFNPVQLGKLLLTLGESVSNTDTVSTMRSKLDKIPSNDLKQALQARRVTVQPGARKEVLQQTLFDSITTEETLNNAGENDISRSSHARSAGENENVNEKNDDQYFWAKGNWLSLVTNVKTMVQVYSSFRDLW